MKRIRENLNGTNENHIFPLFWQHGEDEKILRDYMDKIEQSGIKAVCVEARPHPDFLEKQWWKDMDILIDEAKSRQMNLWILDDSHFPTGFANGAIKDRYPQYLKRYLKLHQLDFVGPMKHAQAIISYAFTDKMDQLEGIYLAKKTGYEAIDPETIIDITKGVNGHKSVSFELPEGEWKLLVLVSTNKGGEPHTEDYLNPIVPEATDVLLEEIYQPHYDHYKEEFGKTILGFFSDEPRFGNIHSFYGSIGRTNMVLPWREDMVELLDAKMGVSTRRLLPMLFVDGREAAHQIRYQYMDLVSDLYSEHFNKRIGNWCQSHQVQYIGHTIEDNNAHARLGSGSGHFFKAMAGQDMAGIDVVLHQLMPGMDNGYNKAMTGNGWDGEFFHYVLAKMGASLGHVDPKKQGKTMCEVYGAYGWSEGNRLMKWITDHMLVRGVNEFCPHAFDPKEYPDEDCPPHIYAHGKNPQYTDFSLLMHYTNRMSHLLSGGIHRATAAVLYHGEAEWSGDYMLMQKPAAELYRNQIDYDFIPHFTFESAKVEEQQLVVHQESYQVLIVPYAEALPYRYLQTMLSMAEQGLTVYILENLPIRSSEGKSIADLLEQIKSCSNIIVVPLDKLIERLRKTGCYEVKCSTYEPYLRCYHYEQPDGHVIMLVNEAPHQTVKTELQVPFSKNGYCYDAMNNTLQKIEDGNQISLLLEPYESRVYCFMEWDEKTKKVEPMMQLLKSQIISNPFKVSFVSSENYPEFSEEMTMEHLVPLQQIEGKEDFTGVIRYETIFDLEEAAVTKLVLNTVYEGARVSVNGSRPNVKICPPYTFDITDTVIVGENTLVIEVTTTLARQQYDWLSQFILLEPTGITESVTIEQYLRLPIDK